MRPAAWPRTEGSPRRSAQRQPMIPSGIAPSAHRMLTTPRVAPESVLISSVSQSATNPRPAVAPTSATSKPTAHTRNTTRPTIACKPDTKVRGARLTRAG